MSVFCVRSVSTSAAPQPWGHSPRRPAGAVLIGALLALLAGGCADEPPVESVGGFELTLAPLVEDGCEASTNGNGILPDGVESLLLRLSGTDYSFEKRLSAEEVQSGQVLIEGIPPGQNLELELFGCAAGATTPAWSGAVQNVDITASEKTGRRVYLTRKDVQSCTGQSGQVPTTFSTDLSQARAMHRTAVTHDGNLLVIGGFTAFSAQTGSAPILTGGDAAVSTITEYRPVRGLFAEWGSVWDSRLIVPRGLHHVVPLNEGRQTLVIGGITRAALVSASQPPLLPQAKDSESIIPSPAVEVLDAEARSVQAGNLGFSPLAWSALAHSPDGTAIILSGGRFESGEASNKLQFVRGSASELISGTANVTTKADNLPQPRMGHSATWLSGDKVLLFGGNSDGAVANVAEILSGENFDSQLVTFSETPADFVPTALHELALVSTSDDGCTSDFLVVGGVGFHGNNVLWVPAANGPARLYTMRIDTCQASGSITASGALGSGALAKRVLHQLTPLGERQFMLSGGYHELAPKQDADCAGDTQTGCYLADLSILSVADDLTVSVARQTRFKRGDGDAATDRPRFAHQQALLPDGSVLTTGGLVTAAPGSENLTRAPELTNVTLPSQTTLCTP